MPLWISWIWTLCFFNQYINIDYLLFKHMSHRQLEMVIVLRFVLKHSRFFAFINFKCSKRMWIIYYRTDSLIKDINQRSFNTILRIVIKAFAWRNKSKLIMHAILKKKYTLYFCETSLKSITNIKIMTISSHTTHLENIWISLPNKMFLICNEASKFTIHLFPVKANWHKF